MFYNVQVIVITTNFSRSNLIESSHKAKVLIKNNNSKPLLSTGNDDDYIYPRSSIKIFQAIPFIKSNAYKIFNLNKKIIALACSSHRGENFHIKELQNWLEKINCKINILKCGIHLPLNPKASEIFLKNNKKINQLYNNCAGKHLAMISSCLSNNYNTSNYLNFNHPHQKQIRNIFEIYSDKKISSKNYGIDGCSAPQYSFRIRDVCSMLNNLVKSYNDNFIYNNEVKLLINSIIKNPKYIGGTDSLDTRIMMISNKKIFCKGGAEGVFLFAEIKKGICGVIKIVDGNERAIPSLIYSLFKKYKIMNSYELSKFKKIYSFKIFNHAKINVGSIETKVE